MAVEILHVRIAIQSELVFAKLQRIQQDLVIKDFRAVKIGDGDVDMIDSGDFWHGVIGATIELEMFTSGRW